MGPPGSEVNLKDFVDSGLLRVRLTHSTTCTQRADDCKLVRAYSKYMQVLALYAIACMQYSYLASLC